MVFCRTFIYAFAMLSVNCYALAQDQVKWLLQSDESVLSFISTKNIHTMEVHEFDNLTGNIDEQGNVNLNINLNSVNTGIEMRDKRMRDVLFETAVFSKAQVTLAFDQNTLKQLPIGERLELELEADLQLHGVTESVYSTVAVTKLSGNKILVVNLLPVIIDAQDFKLVAGLAKLRSLAGLKAISTKVPVNFVLLFTHV